MRVEIARHALDRVPLSIIFDDSTVLVNLNYFFLRDRNIADGEHRRWEDVPVVHPESFTREFAEWCLENGVRGKFSVVPCPAALGRIDEGLPMFSPGQQETWLRMCRELIVPAFDITPEMITHTFVVDPKTMQALASRIWEQYEWATLPVDQEELVIEYIATACENLVNVGLPPQGVTSPGGFGGRTLEIYAKAEGEAERQVHGASTPYYFKRVEGNGERVETPVWYADRAQGTAVGEVIAATGDWTGSWTGYGEVDADRYITADLESGRLVELIDARQPAVLCSHWQGFYGMHNEDRAGQSLPDGCAPPARARSPGRIHALAQMQRNYRLRLYARNGAHGNGRRGDRVRFAGARSRADLVSGRRGNPRNFGGGQSARTGFDASGFTLWEVLAGSRYYLGDV